LGNCEIFDACSMLKDVVSAGYWPGTSRSRYMATDQKCVDYAWECIRLAGLADDPKALDRIPLSGGIGLCRLLSVLWLHC
jgi:hypothetical protein